MDKKGHAAPGVSRSYKPPPTIERRGKLRGEEGEGMELVIVHWREKNGEAYTASMPFQDYIKLSENPNVAECYIVG